MLGFFNKNIKPQAEKIEFALVLPAKESVMFLNGDHYETGSDYSKKELGTSVEDMIDSMCQNCDGKGWYLVKLSEDDVADEPCAFESRCRRDMAGRIHRS